MKRMVTQNESTEKDEATEKDRRSTLSDEKIARGNAIDTTILFQRQIYDTICKRVNRKVDKQESILNRIEEIGGMKQFYDQWCEDSSLKFIKDLLLLDDDWAEHLFIQLTEKVISKTKDLIKNKTCYQGETMLYDDFKEIVDHFLDFDYSELDKAKAVWDKLMTFEEFKPS